MSDDIIKGGTSLINDDTWTNSARSAALDASTSFLDNVLSRQNPMMMHVLDGAARIVEVNRRWLERMGYPLDQVIGRKIAEFMSPATRERIEGDLTHLGQRDFFRGLERELVTANGEIIEAEIEARVIKDESGLTVRSIAVVVDVTKRNQRERELVAREEELRTLIDSSPEGIMIHQEGKFIYANVKACEILGARDSSEIIGKDALEFVHPSVRDEVKKRIRSIREHAERTRSAETLFARVDGESVLVESVGSPVIYEGKPSIQVVFRDISERKRAEAIARENEVQSEYIRVQREMLLAISTPLLPLREHVVLMPLVGTMDDARGDRATETLLRGIGEHGAQVAILDVTGVPAIGPEMAEGIRRTIHAAQLLGAEVVVTGIQPAIARTMIELGMDMTGITTRGTLRDGIAYAFRRAR